MKANIYATPLKYTRPFDAYTLLFKGYKQTKEKKPRDKVIKLSQRVDLCMTHAYTVAGDITLAFVPWVWALA